MKKIGDITNTADKNGEFTDGNVAAGTPPTQLMGAWFNSVQREILSVLAKAGVPQSATKEDQLAEAITKMVASAGYLPTGYSYSKTESDNRYAAKAELGSKLDKAAIVQETGRWTEIVMSQKAVTDALNEKASNAALTTGLEKKLDKTSIVQSTGESTTQVMSQGAATKLFIKPGDAGLGGSAERIYVDALASLLGKSSGFYHSGGDILNLPFSGQWHEFIKIMLTEAYGALFSISAKNQLATNTLDNGAWSGWSVLYGESNTYIDHNNIIKKSNVYLSDCPIGAAIPWPQSTPPLGFLILNGQSFSKTMYPLLALAYPSGTLPDMRDEFIRGSSVGRKELTTQEHALQGHGHAFNYNSNNTTENAPGSGVAMHKDSTTLRATNRVDAPVSLEGYGAVNYAAETRPRNIAFLYIVRAA
ncbi:MAG: phage tail protein [Providencia heimbachae]|nr:phage tail protein [Providencia heimbachae]